MAPSWSKTMQRDEVVPWSMAATNFWASLMLGPFSGMAGRLLSL